MKRWLSALVGVPLACLILIFGNYYVTSLVVGIIAIISMHEYFSAFKEIANPMRWLGYISCLFIFLLPIIKQEYIGEIIQVLLALILLILFTIEVFGKKNRDIKDVAITFLGIAYIIFTLVFVPRIYAMEQGKIFLFMFFFAVWFSDGFAYVIGRHFGKHHFTSISPKKTIEGSVGGVIGAIIANLILVIVCNLCFSMNLSYIYTILISIVLSIIGQIGDLAASSIKRYTNKKDFGNLIPGHGGILDRFDSILLAAPFAYMLFQLL